MVFSISSMRVFISSTAWRKIESCSASTNSRTPPDDLSRHHLELILLFAALETSLLGEIYHAHQYLLHLESVSNVATTSILIVQTLRHPECWARQPAEARPEQGHPKESRRTCVAHVSQHDGESVRRLHVGTRQHY